MKKLFVSLVALVMATMSYAQSTLVATLTHGDNIKMFYGIYALQQAHNAAEDGDIINLSGGPFNATNITKGITIRGTGIYDVFPTKISGRFDINVSPSSSNKLCFEGCWFEKGEVHVAGSTTEACFLKNRFESRLYTGENAKNITFISCNINQGLIYYDNSSLSCYGSYIYNPELNHNATAFFLNCAIIPAGNYQAYYIGNATLVNCFLFNGRDGYGMSSLPATSSAYYCVAVNGGGSVDNAFNDLIVKENCTTADKSIFINGNPWDELTEEAKTQYIGNDGTQIGMYGGPLPYNGIPSYPRITKMNVANKTTADGKLSVEIEVSATE